MELETFISDRLTRTDTMAKLPTQNKRCEKLLKPFHSSTQEAFNPERLILIVEALHQSLFMASRFPQTCTEVLLCYPLILTYWQFQKSAIRS